jgi:hypothetical protein
VGREQGHEDGCSARIFLNIVVGGVGAFLGRRLIAPMLAAAPSNQNDFSVVGLVVSLVGGGDPAGNRQPDSQQPSQLDSVRAVAGL